MAMKHYHKFCRVPAKKTRTWTCTECSWFVHEGLSHVLLSKEGVCWACGDVFKITEAALEEDKPRCDMCRGANIEDMEKYLRDRGMLND